MPASADAPSRHGAATSGRARRSEGAAASAQSKCSRSLWGSPRLLPQSECQAPRPPFSPRIPGADFRERERERASPRRESEHSRRKVQGVCVASTKRGPTGMRGSPPKEESPKWGARHRERSPGERSLECSGKNPPIYLFG